MSLMEPRHLLEDHTSEVKVRLFADTLPELFEEACRALAHILVESPPEASGEREPVRVQARDRATLLAEWLNELIYRTDAEGRLFTAASIERLSDTELAGTIQGLPAPPLKTPVKAATWHDLSVAPLDSGGWTASVVLDV